jgi:hypothetical protein
LQLLFPSVEDLEHEAHVVGEIVRQARAIMQIQGTSELSLLDKEAQEMGWGSIFDPDSEISKNLPSLWGRE